MHGIFYDEIHDEIVVPVALGGAVLTLPGDAAGDAPPKRVLQGPKTGIVQPDTIFVDLKNDELIVESGDDAVLVFPRTAEGNVAPSRRIGGPNSGVGNIYGLATDSKSGCIIVANRVESGARASDDRSWSSTGPTPATRSRATRSPDRTPASSRSARCSLTKSAA